MFKLHTTLTGHRNPIYALAESAKPGILFSAGNDKGIVEWSLNKMEFIMVKWPINSSAYCLCSYEHLLFAGERSGKITCFNFIEQKLVWNEIIHQKPIFDIKILKKKNELLVCSEDGSISIWSLSNFKEIKRIPLSNQTIRKIGVHPEENIIALACKDNRIIIVNTNDYSIINSFEAHLPSTTSISFHPNGDYLISGGRDAQLKVWDTKDYQLIKQIPAHMNSIYKIAFHPTMPIFATASQDKSIKIWDAENFKLFKILSFEKLGVGHKHSVNDLIWTRDGHQLISTGDDCQIHIWD